MALTTTPITSSPATLGTAAAVTAAPVTTAPVAGVQATGVTNASVGTTYTGAPATTAVSGGGGLGDFVGDAIGKITAMAQNAMNGVQTQLTNEMTANGGNVEPARLQQINQQMSTYQMMMEMAAKIQDKQEQAAQVWLRP